MPGFYIFRVIFEFLRHHSASFQAKSKIERAFQENSEKTLKFDFVEIKLYIHVIHPISMNCTLRDPAIGPALRSVSVISSLLQTNKHLPCSSGTTYFLSKTAKATACRIISTILHNGFETENRVAFAAIPVVFEKQRKATWC